jgi:hypothetical protein
MPVALGQVRVVRFIAVLKLLGDFARNNSDFFVDLETWKQTGEMSPSILSFIEGFNLFTDKERKTFVELLKVLSKVLEENEQSN